MTKLETLQHQVITFPLPEPIAKTYPWLKRYTLVPRPLLVKAPWNNKLDNAVLATKLEGNFKRSGQLENIIVRELETGYYEVVNGNHRLDTVDALGIEFVMTHNVGKVSETEAKRIAIETNETQFETDQLLLAEHITEILKEVDLPELARTMPYTEEELENFGKLLEFDWEQFGTPGADEGEEDVAEEEDSSPRLTVLLTDDLQELWFSWKQESGYADDVEAFEKGIEAALWSIRPVESAEAHLA